MSAFASKNVIVDVKDVQSVCSLGNDDLGEDDNEGNILKVERYIEEETGLLIEE